MIRFGLAGLLLASAAFAQPVILGQDAPACVAGQGPAIEAKITGVKDNAGRVKLELYPPTEADFLKDDRDLVAQGKLFRRIDLPAPEAHSFTICMRVPKPGKYAIFFSHNRDGKNKFDFWKDGAGFPANTRIGRARPRVTQALIDVGAGVTMTTIRAQYLHGLGGFSPQG